jgi:hypothetical protein
VKSKRFAVEQIVAALKQVELGMSIADLTRRLEISERWVVIRSDRRALPTTSRLPGISDRSRKIPIELRLSEYLFGLVKEVFLDNQPNAGRTTFHTRTDANNNRRYAGTVQRDPSYVGLQPG